MIILECITEKKKLRIRFNCFIDSEGKIFNNVYNNQYNCQFPKNIREDGKIYEVKDDDLIIVESKTPFYKIKKNNIRILDDEESKIYKTKSENKTEKNILDISTLKIFDIGECVVCLSVPSSIIFIPCAHMCVCNDCYGGIKKTKNCCPLCRKNITKTIINP
jgi:ferredoxin-fold anticodon binding domain-containing protein